MMGVKVQHFEKKKIWSSATIESNGRWKWAVCFFAIMSLMHGGCRNCGDKTKDGEDDTRAEHDRRSGITWVKIPGNEFQMGSESGRPNERPPQWVKVETFRMARTETTVLQYLRCVDAEACADLQSGASIFNWDRDGKENHPVNGVTWRQAVDFCTWAGGRLPSEAEWEYAARSGGKNVTYPWGDINATCKHAVMHEKIPGCGKGRTWEVCSKKAGNTEHGLCDMAGNVWEWVQDVYHENHYGVPEDGSARKGPEGATRVLRGGGFDTSFYLQTTTRMESNPDDDLNPNRGFRCAKDG